MQRFWEKVIYPIVQEYKPKHIVEIGAQYGKNTVKIAQYCKTNSCRLSCIDPFPAFDFKVIEDNLGDKFTMYEDLSLNVVGKLSDIDLVLIDGDHNWYTVFNELKLIYKKEKDKFPLVFFHDIGWPYGRRDLYYNVENIAPEFINAHKKAGIIYGQSQLADNDGINAHLDNAIYENNNKNGVLTAIEDFIEETPLNLEFIELQGLNGLGILALKENSISNVIKDKKFILNTLKLIEEDRLNKELNIVRLNKKKEALDEIILKKEEDKQALEESLSVIEKKLQESEQKIQESAKTLDIKDKEIDALAQESINLSKKIEILENSLSKKEEDKQALEESLSVIEKKLQESEQKIQESAKTLDIKDKEIDALAQESINLSKKIEILENSLSKKEEDKQALEEKLIEKYDEIIENNIHTRKLESINDINIKNIEKLYKKIEQLNNKNIELLNNVKTRKELIFKKEQEIQKLNELAQSMRLVNRFKRALYIDNTSPIVKTLKSIKNDGVPSTVAKIKNRLLSPKPQIENKQLQNSTKLIKNNMLEIKKEVEKNYIPKLQEEPLVSLLILTKDGLSHLKRLFRAISENTLYKNFEIIVVDNASTDATVEFLKTNEYKFKLQIIENSKNESFSYANNQAAKIAKGEYLLLLNNDIEPLKGWLTHLMNVMQTQKNVGSVGAQLLYPYDMNEPFSTKVQHAGIAFRSEYIEELKLKFFRPYNLGIGKKPIVKNSQPAIGRRVALTAACLLVKKDVYFDVDGLDERYNYGYEDVDFGLKLHQKGYVNYYSQNSILFHYESSTQKLESQKNIKGRRIDNINLLHKKWNNYIANYFYFEKFKNKTGLFAEKKLKIAFAVTEAGDNAVAGDYFTALELANAFKSMGYDITFLRRRGGQWYNVPKDVNVLVSMLDAYDLTQIKDKSNNLITIAWIRNWPDRWLANQSFSNYNLVFASSKTLCNMISEASGKDVTLFPIATTPEKFTKKNNKDKNFESDYSFTGNYWGKPREIETFLEPSELDFQFHIYGKDWHQVKKFKKYHKGFLKYEDIPKVYANSKITIDDAVVGITKPYGSVNSRVFDAIAGGTLVVSNGVVGAQETFGDLLPTYETKEELHLFLQEYLNDDVKRNKRIQELQEFVFNYHTYRIRAQHMKQKMEEFVGLKKSIVIKMPIPTWKEAKTWGDYHLALGLQKQFEQKGYYCLLQVLPEWDNEEGAACDVVLVLRGLSKYNINKHQINFMWNISHPDKVSVEEYNNYDIVFVSSSLWARKLQKTLNTRVEIMHQCTDPDIFKPYNNQEYKHQLLFVGNSRKIFRKALQYLLPTQYELAVFGTLWEKLIDAKYIKAQHIENTEVYKYYSNTDIVLNDHWDSMRENGFISNRIFDVLACNGFILTDDVVGIEELFADTVITYSSKDDFNKKIDYFLQHEDERKSVSQKGRKIVLQRHTYKNRVEQIVEILEGWKK